MKKRIYFFNLRTVTIYGTSALNAIPVDMDSNRKLCYCSLVNSLSAFQNKALNKQQRNKILHLFHMFPKYTTYKSAQQE